MTDYKLFTYDDPDDEADFAPVDQTDFDTITEANKSLLLLLAQYCPVDKAKNILDQVKKTEIWLGIGKRESEIVKRWDEKNETHPWLPEIISVTDFNLVAKDAAPITQNNLFTEVNRMVEILRLCNLCPDTTIKSITIMPAWQLAEKKGDFLIKVDSFDGSKYQINDVDTANWKIIAKKVIAQFEKILPDLGLDPQHPQEIKEDKCKPAPDIEGLCGAWYIMEFQDFLQAGHTNQKWLKVRVPVGLLKPQAGGSSQNSAAEKTSFEEPKTEIYTYGLDFRFLCEKDAKETGQKSFAMQFQSKLTFLISLLILKKISVSASDNFMRPVKEFNTLKRELRLGWLMQKDYNVKTKLAANIAPEVVGKEPLAIFTENGIHLLNDKEQIGAWSARNNLLDKLFYAPPWNNNAEWLEKNLDELFQNDGSCWKKSSARFPGGLEALTDDVIGIGNASDSVTQLLTVRASVSLGITQANQKAWNDKFNITIREFRRKSGVERMEFINDLWSMLTTAYRFDKSAIKMWEPPYDDDRNMDPLPTSWCPKTPGAKTYHKRLEPGSLPWNLLGVGFRVEGRWSELNNTLDRYKKNNGQGMTQARINKDYMSSTKKMDFTGTKLDDPTQFFFWNANNDTFNETAVCVSRNFFGATAFPERDSKDEYVLFALDCFNLKGVDTESIQMKINRHWRPGEKAFERIPYENVIGWVRISRTGGEKGINWKFQITATDQWAYNRFWEEKHMDDGNYVERRKTYIETELDAWRGAHEVDGTKYDFAYQ